MSNQPIDRPPLIERLQTEADQCRNDGADDIAHLLDEAVTTLQAAQKPCRCGPDGCTDSTCPGRAGSAQSKPEREPIAWYDGKHFYASIYAASVNLADMTTLKAVGYIEQDDAVDGITT